MRTSVYTKKMGLALSPGRRRQLVSWAYIHGATISDAMRRIIDRGIRKPHLSVAQQSRWHTNLGPKKCGFTEEISFFISEKMKIDLTSWATTNRLSGQETMRGFLDAILSTSG